MRIRNCERERVRVYVGACMSVQQRKSAYIGGGGILLQGRRR